MIYLTFLVAGQVVENFLVFKKVLQMTVCLCLSQKSLALSLGLAFPPGVTGP